MLAKLSLLLLLESTSLLSPEQEKVSELPFLPTEIYCKIADSYIVNNAKTPKQFIQTLEEILINVRLSFSLFNLTKDRIVSLIKKISEVKGYCFIERTIFKALFKKKVNLVSWLYYGLKPEIKSSLSSLLCSLIYFKFSPGLLHRCAVSLISGRNMPIYVISTSDDVEELKALTDASFFVLKYTDLSDVALKSHLIKNYIVVLQGLAYAYEMPQTPNNEKRVRVLLKFLAKLCALQDLTLPEIESIYESFFKQAENHIRENLTIHPAYAENRSKFLKKSYTKKEEVMALLTEKCKFYQQNVKYIPQVLYKTHSNQSSPQGSDEYIDYLLNDCILF